MMVHFVGQQSRAGHKAESLVKVPELELFVDGIAVILHCPPFSQQSVELVVAFFCGQFI